MGARLRGLSLVAVVLAVGAFLGSAVSQWRSPSHGGAAADDEAVPAAEPVRAPPGVRVRVEVLNGGGRQGMARAATEHLRDRDFDVVFYGNAATFDHDSSVVIDRVERPELARAVAAALGVATVRSEPDPNLYLDVSVVLGAGWEPPAEPADTTVAPAPPAWWDIRRFFRRDRATEPLPRGRMTDPGDDGSGSR